ncbi:ufm1-specific protease 2 isoform X1 [Scleropages formosus]|uniref:ufm1-specific protease 2 isoform X1 n=1 Tax=Scleropages formosus TaxID=113540 RepID=UPI0008786959|nr:ufm1-specific protease 2 isoform X1 [Scleropages formosus]
MVVEKHVMFRVRGGLDFTCQLDRTDESYVKQTLGKAFESVRSAVRSPSLVFGVQNSPVFLWPNRSLQATRQGVTENTTCRELQQHIQINEGDSGKRSSKKKDKKDGTTSIINVDLLTEVTEPVLCSAPMLFRQEGKHHFVKMKLPADCVVSAHMDETIGEYVCCGLPESEMKCVCTHLVEALCTQLTNMEEVVLRHRSGTSLPIPEPFHFLLPEPVGLITAVYPAGVPDTQLEPVRKELHRRLELPDDRSCMRRANAYHFPDEPYRDGYLRSPHLALNHPSLEGTKLYLVQGIYSYHHYMQDRMDDNGWGCAYRSLQTICSWFQQQGYVERVVPSHKEIQQALVDVGDKPASFVGSRQWIGSIEVQAVLSHLLGITSKILFVSQGSDLATKGRELANHFSTEGTPIMIGGGVLAHTILGVMWSETSGEIKFLVLDPHYTGGEDLQVITDKGWCGWKGPDFWDQRAYYNLCLPQRPRAI